MGLEGVAHHLGEVLRLLLSADRSTTKPLVLYTVATLSVLRCPNTDTTGNSDN